jgi:hypothetical protein
MRIDWIPSYPAIITIILSIGLIVLAVQDPDSRPAVIEVGKLAVAGYIGFASHGIDDRQRH